MCLSRLTWCCEDTAATILRGLCIFCTGYSRWAWFRQHLSPSSLAPMMLCLRVESGAQTPNSNIFFPACPCRIGLEAHLTMTAPPCCSEKQHVPLDTYIKNLRQIMAHLQSIGANATVMITPPPVYEPDRLLDRQRKHGISAATALAERTNAVTGAYCSLLCMTHGATCIS